MPLKLARGAITYWWPVKIQIPLDGGRHDEQSFDAKFRQASNKKMMELNEKPAADMVRELIVDWKGVFLDETDQPTPFSDSNLDELLDRPGFAGAILSAYNQSIIGARQKN